MTELFSHGQHEDLGNRRFRTTLGLKSVNFERNGVWRRVTDVLGATGDPNFPIGADELVQFRLDNRIAGKSPLMYFGRGQSRGTFSLLGANNVSGVVSGNSVKFLNAWDNADLTYTLGGHILRKDILFRTGHPREIGFWINENVGFNPETLIFGNDFRILQPILRPPAGSDKMDVPLTWQVAQQGGKWLLTVMLPEGDWAGWVLDPTLTLQPQGADGKDTYIFSDAQATYNYGISIIMQAGNLNVATNARGLIQFDVSSIPPSATIISAVLTLYCTWEHVTTDYDVQVHQSLVQWFEGMKDDVAPAVGQDGSTWNLCNANGSVAWLGGVGGGSGQDFVATATATATITGIDTYFTWNILPDVSAWVAGTATNYGLWLRNASEGTTQTRKFFASSDHATAAYRPKLIIDYTLPAGGAIFNVPFSAPFRGPFG